MITAQKKLIHKRDWDILCVLDACRYDYFADAVGDYLNGTLQKVYSPASSTAQWMNVMFGETHLFEDVTYISGHPAINSGGLHFTFNRFFLNVIDVWQFGWDDVYGTTPPDKVTTEILKQVKLHPVQTFIAHYVQPHGPYLSLDPDPSAQHILHGQQIYKVYKEKGLEATREAYRKNVEAVLEAIVPLSDLDKKVILTADHGEVLGEKVDYGQGPQVRLAHPGNEEHAVLRTVPWFEIK